MLNGSELNTKSRQMDWLQVMAHSIHFIDERRLPVDEEVVQSWRSALRAEIGDDELYEDVISPPSPADRLPV